jgi:cytochrome c
VAARYRGQPGAEARLVQAVVSGSNPYASHWKDQVAGLAMPPNATQVNEADARRLVRWILGMAPGATR